MPIVQFTPEMDLAILRQVAADRPFLASHGEIQAKWKECADHLKPNINLGFRKLRERYGELYNKFNGMEETWLPSSGINEPIPEELEIIVGINELLYDRAHQNEPSLASEQIQPDFQNNETRVSK